MDHEIAVVEFKPDDFKEIAGEVGADTQDLGRIGIGVEVGDDERVRDSMKDGFLVVAMLERGPVKLHTRLS